MKCPDCGKRRYTDKDMADYGSRSYCVGRGDCQCPLCSVICWAPPGKCAELPRKVEG